jgi:uncharacterized membrane protein YgdD (TMEM256/DUF423 family)
MDRRFLFLGALSAFAAVAAGAFGAHALRVHLSPELLAVYETGARYQMYHALAMLGVGFAPPDIPGRLIPAAGWCFFWGTILFSGSLYMLALTGIPWLGAVTPIGGILFLAGWACLAGAALQSK